MDAKEFIEKGVVWLSDIYHPTIHIIISATERDFGPVISSHIAAWAEGAPCYIYYVDSSKV